MNGHEDWGPWRHYVHRVVDKERGPIDIYHYYLDAHGRPVLDGDRTLYRTKREWGKVIFYRDGRVTGTSQVVIRG